MRAGACTPHILVLTVTVRVLGTLRAIRNDAVLLNLRAPVGTIVPHCIGIIPDT